jgi:acyl carrier protein
MITPRRLQVTAAISHYLGGREREPFFQLQLRRDLGFEPLDLVLFVLAFEEPEGLIFPFEQLEQVTVVGELIDAISAWLEDYDERERLADQDDFFGKESGTWPAISHPENIRAMKA